MKRSLALSARILCSFIVTLIFITISPVFANDGSLGVTPDGVYPITQSDIKMKSEEIFIDCTTGNVTCRFDFKNYGEAQSVLMGFPARLNEYVDGLTTEESISVIDFTARDKNGDIPVTLVNTIPNPPLKEVNGMEEYSKWYTFSVDFDENEEKTLYHTYKVQFSHFSNGEVQLGYVIETGSLWKGSIGHSKVIFYFGEIPMYAITQVSPNNFYRIEDNKLIFERSNFKPDYNLNISMNQARYNDLNWFDVNYSGNESKESAKKKIELLKTSPKAIRKDHQKYYQLYQSLINNDPISALYIKSALALPNGNEKPKITECRIAEHVENTWRFEIYGTDPDGDLVRHEAEIDGIENYRYVDDGGELYYNNEEMKFISSSYLELQEDVKKATPLSITFTFFDSAGNSDTETMLLQAEPPAPVPTETPIVTPQSTPIKDDPGNAMPANQSVNKGERLIPMEAETISLLITGVIIVLALSLIVITSLLIKRKSRGYFLFIVQLIFTGLSFYQLIEIYNIRDNTDGLMSSEAISGKIGISAVLWAIGMLCMLAGIIMTNKERKTIS